MSDSFLLDRNLSMEVVRVTETTAISAFQLMGGGDERAADQAAVVSMHSALNSMVMDGTVRIGEGLQSDTEKLYTGESVGTGIGPKVDVAVLPLEGKSIVARGGPNAMSVIAMAEHGGFLDVPDIYMEKIAIGPGFPDGVVDLDTTPSKNLNQLAEARGCHIKDLIVCLLDRPLHTKLIAAIRETGVRIRMILDGDVSGIIQVAEMDGGASQGILAAAALRGLGGQMQGRLILRNAKDLTALKAIGIDDSTYNYSVNEMAFGHVTFAATGVTYGAMLNGVKIKANGVITHSMVTCSQTGTLRYIKAHYDFTRRYVND